jgi:hypothetical protein
MDRSSPKKKKRYDPELYKTKTFNQEYWDQQEARLDRLDRLDEMLDDPKLWQPPRRQKPLDPRAPDPPWMINARKKLAKEFGDGYTLIRPGQWEQHEWNSYAEWIHTISRTVYEELGWEDSASEIRVYRPLPKWDRKHKKDIFLWRFVMIYKIPRDLTLEVRIDPGDFYTAPFIREIEVRFTQKFYLTCPLVERRGEMDGVRDFVVRVNEWPGHEARGIPLLSLLHRVIDPPRDWQGYHSPFKFPYSTWEQVPLPEFAARLLYRPKSTKWPWLPEGEMRERIRRESGVRSRGPGAEGPSRANEVSTPFGTCGTDWARDSEVSTPCGSGGATNGISRTGYNQASNPIRATREDSRLKAVLKTPAPDPQPKTAREDDPLKAVLRTGAPDLDKDLARKRATVNAGTPAAHRSLLTAHSRERRIMRWKPETRRIRRVVDQPPPGVRLTPEEKQYYDWAYLRGGAPDYQTLQGKATLPSLWPRWDRQRELPPRPKRGRGRPAPIRPVGTARERFDRVRTCLEFQPKGRRVEVFARLVPRGKSLRLKALLALVDEVQQAVEYVPPREPRAPNFWERLRRAAKANPVLRRELREMLVVLREVANEWPTYGKDGSWNMSQERQQGPRSKPLTD